MKIALVYPRYRYPSGDPPLSLAYLSAVFKKNGIEPDIYDSTFEKNPRSWLLDRLAEINYDIVGISAMITQIKDALEVAQTVKFFHPKSTVIIGGAQATVMPERVIEHPAVDAVCIGEGEAVAEGLAQAKGRLEDVDGIWYKKDGEVIKNNPAQRLNFDDIPLPDFAGLKMDRYLENWFQMDSVSPDLHGVPIMASRGCPYHCAYCQPTLDKLFGKKLRKRSPLSIIEELQKRIKDFGINAFIFVDDTFPADRKWATEVCEALESAGLKLKWGANVRADLVDKELLTVMKRAGLAKIFIGVESASDRILKEIYRKGITIEQVSRAVECAKELGIKVQGYFMLGAPTETKEEVERTIKYAVSSPIDEAVFNLTTPLPGVELYERFSHLIKMSVEEMDYYRVSPWKGKEVLDASFLRRMQLKAYFSFYTKPARFKSFASQIFSPRFARKNFLKLKRIL